MRRRSAGPDGRAGRPVQDGQGTFVDQPPDSPSLEPRIPWWIWPAAAAAPAAVLALAMAAQLGSPWRPVAALVFLTVGPGASLAPLIGLRDPGMELTLVIPLSFALVALSSAALFYARLWSPDRELSIMLGLCLVGLALQYLSFRRRPSPAG